MINKIKFINHNRIELAIKRNLTLNKKQLIPRLELSINDRQKKLSLKCLKLVLKVLM